MQLHCPSCRQGFEATVAPGASVACPACGAAVTAPLFDAGSQSKDEARQERRRRQSSKALVLVLAAVAVCIVLFAALMVPALLASRSSARRMLLSNRLKNIVLALHNYQDEYGTFPPAYVTDETGKPMHSWRILLLTQMNEPGPWQAYDFSQPWDSPNNLAAAAQVPHAFQNPYASDGDTTCYMMVTGQGSSFEGGATPKAGLGGGLAEAVVVEVSSDAYLWTAPVDLNLGQLSGEINSGAPGQLNSRLPDGVMVGYRDGRVGVVKKETSREEVLNLFRRP